MHSRVLGLARNELHKVIEARLAGDSNEHKRSQKKLKTTISYMENAEAQGKHVNLIKNVTMNS